MTVHDLLAQLHSLGVRISVEGGRVHVRSPKGAIGEDLWNELRDRKGELIELLEELHVAEPEHPPLAVQSRPSPLPASFGQQRLWFMDRLGGRTTEYHILEALRLAGPLDYAALHRAIQTIAARHESLRTSFGEVEGVPVQIVSPSVIIPVPVEDVPSEDDIDARIAAAVEEERRTPFDLTCGPLLRFRLLRMGAADHVLLRTVHHIVFDAWSEAVFHREFVTLYGAYRDGKPNPLPPLPVQYADFTLWQRSRVGAATFDRGLAYWTSQLADLPEEVGLPRDRSRRDTRSFAAGVCHCGITGEQVAALKELGQAHGATLYMTLLAAFAALLSRYNGHEDIVIGSPIANRQDPQLDDLIGFFVNALVLRIRVDPHEPFPDLLRRVRQTTLDAYQHQDIPFERVVEAVAPKRSMSRSPLFQVHLALQNAPRSETPLPGLTATRIQSPGVGVHCDLEVHAAEDADGLTVAWLYDRELFERARIEQVARHYAALLECIARGTAQSVGAIDFLDGSERLDLIENWNNTVRQVPRAPFHSLVEERAALQPDAVAAVFDDEHVTYEGLNRRANVLARHLRRLGVDLETRVALCAEPSVDLVVSFLAILKAGAAFVPLDPTYPSERLASMLATTDPPVIVSHRGLDRRLPAAQAHVVHLDLDRIPCAGEEGEDEDEANLDIPVPLDCGAYVIHTSGSTGRPHGVVASHAGLVNTVAAQVDRFRLGPGARVLQAASICFDASVSEVATALAAGSTLAFVPRNSRIGLALRDHLVKHSITHVTLTPVVLGTVPPECPHPTEVLVVGGEACSGELAASWSDRCVMINAYGPTEASVCATMSGPLSGAAVPSIGTPIWNARTYVLDARLEPVPAGVVGELYVAGAGVARGYLKEAGLTSSRFVADPYGSRGARMYRTGDLARWRHDGQLDFVGRVDHQVKVRGHRVELSEIECALARHANVSEAIVLLREDRPGDRRLVGYVVCGRGQVDAGHLHERLRQSLPEYMVPAAVVVLEEWPVTPSGKLDRAALPEPRAIASTVRHVKPETPPEILLCQLFAEVLGVPDVGVTDNFFELGGHSLLAAQLAVRVHGTLGLQLTIGDLFEAPTVQSLIPRLSVERMMTGALERIFPLRPRGSLPPLLCIPPGGGLGWSYAGLLNSIDAERPIIALQTQAVANDIPLPESVDAVTAEYLALVRSLQPTGPYHLVGWSFGGLAAHAVACRLQQAGERVALLAIIDGFPAVPDAASSRPSDDAESSERAALRAAEAPVFGLDAIQNQRMWRLVYQMEKVAATFRPDRFEGDVLLFTSAGLLTRAARWAPYVSGVIESHEAECEHKDMMRDESIRFIGQRIRQALESAEETTAPSYQQEVTS